jgi:broad specificity phosphatase PhoE
MRRLILVRHAAPAVQPAIPARDWPLSSEGRLQAERLAARLTSLYAPPVIFSSPERKAVETAGLIACALGLKVERVTDLREHDRTGAGYLSADAFAASIARFFACPEELVFGRESAVQAGARFAAAVRALSARTPDRDILLVTHGTVLTLYAVAVASVEPLPFWRGLGMPAAVVLSLPDHRLLQRLQPPWPT